MVARLQALKLSRQDEVDLFCRFALGSGDEKERLRQEIVEGYLWLVQANVIRFGRSHREDLEQEGAMALYQAVDRFDYRRGLRFSTYAVHWLNQAFHLYLYNHSSTIRLPVYMHKIMSRMRQGKDVSRLAGRSVDAARVLNERRTLSIDMASLLVSQESDAGEGMEVSRALRDGLESLQNRERYLIEQRFLVGRSYRDLGDQDGVSAERIRQIVNRGLKKMRTSKLEELL